jgi:tripartite-type tricarboxylate transporter receptor subunit TctC
MRRREMLSLLAAGALGLGAQPALGQDYPARPIRLLVGFPPGAQTDAIARLVGARLEEQLGQSVVIENRSGAIGTIAAETAARAADGNADRRQQQHGAGALIFTTWYDPPRDFVAIGRIARVALVVAVNAKCPQAPSSS